MVGYDGGVSRTYQLVDHPDDAEKVVFSGEDDVFRLVLFD